MHNIHIDWEGPHTYDEVKKMKGRVDFGIYQFYGCHSVYGADTLLYIGKAQEGTFGSRMTDFSDHNIRFDKYSTSGRMDIYAGRLAGGETPGYAAWSKEIELAEKLLICAHSPAWNSQELNVRIVEGCELFDIHVFNWGKHERLLPEVSGRRYARDYPPAENYQIYSTE